jgi:hypothetical protein
MKAVTRGFPQQKWLLAVAKSSNQGLKERAAEIPSSAATFFIN